MRRELRGKSQAIKATVHVGKDGLTDSVVAETKNQLEKAKLVKVKALQSFDEDFQSLAEALAMRTSSALVETRGRTIVLAKD